MKNYLFYILFFGGFFTFSACQKDVICFKTTGKFIMDEPIVSSFDSIYCFSGITLELAHADSLWVQVKARENIRPSIDVYVENNTLLLRDNSTCNLLRPYDETVVTVHTPSLELIRHYSNKDLIGLNVLKFPVLRVIINANSVGGGVGDAYISVDNELLAVESNSVARFFISGKSERVYVGFFGGTPRFEGENYTVERFQFFQRSAGRIIANPTNSIEGNIYGTGNVYSLNNPPLVNVNTFSSGKLIFW